MGLNPPIENMWLRFFHHPEGRWIMKLPEARTLYDIIKKYQPSQILELGTGIGCSTMVMATALENGRIMTIEQSKKCINIAKEMIPFELKQMIQFEYSPATVIKPIYDIDPFRGWSAYLNFPWVNWDFIMIDGPSPFMIAHKGVQHLVDLPNGDIICLLARLQAGAKVYVDGRKDTVNLYKRFLGWYLDLVEEDDYYALFERTKEKIEEDLSDFKNSDMVRGKLEELGYFE